MKSKIVKFWSVAMIALLLTGCKAQTGESQASGASDAQQKEESSAETESATSGNTNPSEEKTRTDENLISEDEAKNIALKDAGLKEDQTSGIEIKLETDDGIQQYDIDFYVGDKEYDYDIDAMSGNILSKDTGGKDDSKKTDSKNVAVSEAQAKKIALKKVSGAGESDIKIHLDHENGKAVYEGDIVYKERKYEFEIDADSGDILDWEDEPVHN